MKRKNAETTQRDKNGRSFAQCILCQLGQLSIYRDALRTYYLHDTRHLNKHHNFRELSLYIGIPLSTLWRIYHGKTAHLSPRNFDRLRSWCDAQEAVRAYAKAEQKEGIIEKVGGLFILRQLSGLFHSKKRQPE